MKQFIILILFIALVGMAPQTDCSKIQKRCDSLETALNVQNFRVNRIRYFTNICNKNPQQDKFLRGWINRSLK